MKKMDSYKFHHDIRVEKANAISRHRKITRLTTMFRFLELFVFLIILSSFTNNQTFAFSFSLSTDSLRGISVTLISPRFVFLLGNAIIAVLFFKSGHFSSEKSDKNVDFYDEYVEKCRRSNNHGQQTTFDKEVKMQPSDQLYPCRNSVSYEVKKMRRCESENLVRAAREKERLRRSVSERCRKSGGAADEMSSEEFRRTVEAFIERQQRVLREEEGGGGFINSAVVSV